MFSKTYKVTTSEFNKCVLNVVLCSKNRLYVMKEISRHVVRVTGHIILQLEYFLITIILWVIF